MSFKAREFTTTDVTPPKSKKVENATDEPKATRLNQELTIGQKAPVGKAKELLIVPVGMIRAVTQYGPIHALMCLDPASGEEGILFLNTKMAEHAEANGEVRHFVAGNFDGNALQTFGVRVSKSLDNGYEGDYTECDGEWDLDPDFYGKPVYLIRKAIAKKSGKGTYQVMERRECTEEFPDLPEYLAAYEARREARMEGTGGDSDNDDSGDGDKKEAPKKASSPSASMKTDKKKPAKAKAKAKPEPRAKPTDAKGAAAYAKNRIEANAPPAGIVLDLTMDYDMTAEEATGLVESIVADMAGDMGESAEDTGDDFDVEDDPVYSRAMVLFEKGVNNLEISDTLDREFRGIDPSAKVDSMKRARAAVRSGSRQ